MVKARFFLLFLTISPFLPEVDPCECVPWYTCKKSKDFGESRPQETLISPRININGECPNYLEVCCEKENIVNSTLGSSSEPVKISCGRRNEDGVNFRIYGNDDNEAEFGEFPWMIALLRSTKLAGQVPVKIYKCGGALIHPQVVVTAAHCVYGIKNKFIARAGEWDVFNNKEHLPHQDRHIKEIVIHKDFYTGALHNDIALLFLSEPFKIKDNVGLICLPPQDYNFEHSECVASGWGKNIYGRKGRHQGILRKVDLPILSRAECQDRIRAKVGRYFGMHESWICAGGEKNVDTCTGDGGSPLVCEIEGKHGRYYHAGMVGWGLECGRNIPGGYVNVAHFRNWIDAQMKCHKYSTLFYKYE